MEDNFEIFDHPILTDKEFADLKIKEGDYQFTVVDAKPKISKSGNKMVVLTNEVFDDNGKKHTMTDYLVSMESMAYKTKHFWESVGYPDRYLSPNKVTDYINRSGYVSIKAQKNNLTGNMENKIKDYIVSSKKTIKVENFIDDEIPF